MCDEKDDTHYASTSAFPSIALCDLRPETRTGLPEDGSMKVLMTTN